ncbi:MAG: hypothetical protein AAF711_01095 [Planctomycetota bacterium]
MTNTTKTQPVDHIRIGAVEATIWANTTKDNRTFYSVQIQRKYTDQNGDPQNASGFNLGDLPAVEKVSAQALIAVQALNAVLARSEAA